MVCGEDVVVRFTGARTGRSFASIKLTVKIVGDCVCPWWRRWFRRLKWWIADWELV